MGSDWRDTALSELADLTGGFAFKSADYSKDGCFVLRTLNIGDDGSISREDAVYIPESLCPQYERFSLQAGDTLFVMVGATLGKVGYVRNRDLPALLNQNMWLIRAKQNVSDARFVHYAFRHAVKASLSWASGSARDFVRRDDYRNLLIVAPSLTEQRAIAHILGTLDDKIELNRRMSETLEAMARALFKSWFVDFDPVRAKMEGRDTGLPREIANLFPSRMVESELGEIPEGWEVRTLGDVISQRLERCSPSDETRSRPYVPIECIATRSLLLSQSKPGGEAQSSLTRFCRGDLLFGAMRPYFHKVAIAPFDGTTRTTVFVLGPRSPDDFAFAALLLHDPKTIEYATNHSTGSTIPYAVWQGSLEAMPAVLPPKQIRALFNLRVKSLLDRLPPMLFETNALAALRDALMPKLISGEIRIPAAVRHFEDATA